MDTPKDSLESPFLLTTEAAALIRHNAGTLENWRVQRIGPPYLRTGKRGSLVLYDKDELLAWVRSQQHIKTVTEPYVRKANGSSKAKK